jgi:SAM-dependent methyltransferase
MSTLYTHPEAYDAIHGSVATGDFLRFYASAMERFGAPALELGCGSGRLLVPLAGQGYKIVGVDSSVPMLRLAQQKADASGIKLQLNHADMRSFNLGRRFRTIVCAGNSFQHLLHRQDVETCLASVRSHLMRTGRLVLDVFNPSLARLLNGKGREIGTWRDVKSGHAISMAVEGKYDGTTQINHGRYLFEDKTTKRRSALSFSMRQFFPQELESLLIYNGFAIQRRYGDYDRRLFSASAPRQVIVASPR